MHAVFTTLSGRHISAALQLCVVIVQCDDVSLAETGNVAPCTSSATVAVPAQIEADNSTASITYPAPLPTFPPLIENALMSGNKKEVMSVYSEIITQKLLDIIVRYCQLTLEEPNVPSITLDELLLRSIQFLL